MSIEALKPTIPLIPAITTQPGRYLHTTEGGKQWEYVYDIAAAGTKSERRIGQLHADGLRHVIAGARPGDRIQTPWGVMLRVSDSPYERGFLLEHTHGGPIEPGHGKSLPVPAALRERGGRWTAVVGLWRYVVTAMAMGSKSERRIGSLHFSATHIVGNRQGDYMDAPWGRLRWMGPVDLSATTDYEQGMLLRGTTDRPLDELTGDAIVVDSAGRAVRLESYYLDGGVRLAEDGPATRGVSLMMSGSLDGDGAMPGALILDPNHCTLNEFGDREACTRMAVHRIEVRIVLQRLADPKHLDRRYFQVTGEGLPPALGLVIQGAFERCYLTLDQQVMPLYADHGA